MYALLFQLLQHLESEFWLVDEVLAVGDVGFQKKCLGKMDYIGRPGPDSLVCKPQYVGSKRTCSSAILLDQGRKVFAGSVDEVVNCYLDSFLNKL